MPDLSNKLADLAERVKDASIQSAAAQRQSVEKAIEAGGLLVEAKAAVRHGEWLPFLNRASVHERQARRLIRLWQAGIEIGPMSDLGGIAGTLSFISKWRMPTFDEALMITSAARQREFDAGAEWIPGAVGYVWECHQTRGHFNLATIDGRDLVSMTRRPMLARLEMEGDRPVDTVIYWLVKNFEVPIDDWHIDFMRRHVPEIVLGSTWHGPSEMGNMFPKMSPTGDKEAAA